MTSPRAWSRLLSALVFAALALAPRAGAVSPNFTIVKTFDSSGFGPLEAPVQGSGGYLYGGNYFGGANSEGTLFRVMPDGSGYSVIHTFGGGFSGDGNLPWGVIVGPGGTLYGTTDQGGSSHIGTIFTLQPDGSGYVRLHTFTGTAADGSRPFCLPVLGPGGLLYGTTYAGGTSNLGVVYSMATDGTGFTVLHSFTGGAGDGSNPIAALTVANDGALYGVAQSGGSASSGVVFKLQPNGSGYTVLHHFASGVPGDGVNPKKRMIQATDGALYGTTAGNGVLFKLQLNGTGYTLLHSFATNGSSEPGVIQASDGKLYGTTIDGGTASRGSVYAVNLDGTGFTVLRSFLGGNTDGWYPGFSVIQASDGKLYGTTRFGGPLASGVGQGPGTIFTLNLDGSGASTPFIFPLAANQPSTPLDGLIQANDGALYGTTSAGGSANEGTVMKIQPDGSGFTVLHSFIGGGTDGATANDGVVQATDGALYGVTYAGGSANYGTVYKIQRDGTGFTLLHSFLNGPADGASPRGRLIQATDGVLYGTTSNGGANLAGTVFKLNLDGSGYTVLYSFLPPGSPTDGQNPNAGVIQASDGALYGTTLNGGNYGVGTVFKLQRNGTGYTMIHFFDGALTDYDPRGGLLQGADGALYGTAYGSINFYGGVSDYGAVYKVRLDGSGYTVLHVFAGSTYDGGFPAVSLIKAANGSLYGSTSGGVTFYGSPPVGNGSLFRINEDGSGYSQLYTFTGNDTDGYLPTALVQATNGDFYGMTYGSATRLGLLFRATLGDLAPVAANQMLTPAPGTPTPVTLSATDANGDALTYILVTPPLNGTLTGTAPNLSYNSGAFTGTDTLTYVVSDGSVFSTLATVTLNVGATGQTINFPALANQVFGVAPFAISATASSGLPVTFSILSGPATVSGNTVTLTGAGTVVVQAAQAGNGTYSAATTTQSFTVAPAPPPVVIPAISLQPANQLLAFGGSVNLSVTASGTSPLGYQWLRDGLAIPGATSATYAATIVGTYTVVVSNAAGSVTSTPATVITASRLSNVSGRVRVGAGDSVLILGLVVSGQPGVTKPFLIRAAGPVLATYGVASPLAQPQLAVYSGATLVAANSGWGTAPNPAALASAATSVGAFAFAPGSADSALLANLLPGTYSVVIQSADASTGIALAEAYELNTAGGQLVNLSARVRAGTGDDTAIVGFFVAGSQPAKVLIRGIGPGLVPFGVTGTLVQPQLTVYAGSTVIAANQGWGTSANPAALAAAAATAGAFPLTPGSADSAVILTLAPGGYTAQVTGVANTSGVALVEVYQLP